MKASERGALGQRPVRGALSHNVHSQPGPGGWGRGREGSASDLEGLRSFIETGWAPLGLVSAPAAEGTFGKLRP